MQEVLINQEFSLSCPDGFYRMDREELEKAYLDVNPNRFGIRNTEKHMMISVWWHVSSPILIKMAGNAKSVCKSTEAKMKKAYKNHAYRCGGFFPAEVGGNKAYGVRYEYTLNGTEQYCETVIAIHKNCCYTIYYYTRKEEALSNRPEWEEILASARFV